MSLCCHKPLTVEIRLATDQDIGHLAGIELAAGKLFPTGLLPNSNHTHPQADLLHALAVGLLVVATVDNTVAGFAVCRPLGGHLHLDEISVHPTFGRQGIGRRLVQHVLLSAGELQLQGTTLTTFIHIPWNAPFYTSCGFSTVDEEHLSSELAAILCAEASEGLIQRVAMRATSIDIA